MSGSTANAEPRGEYIVADAGPIADLDFSSRQDFTRRDGAVFLNASRSASSGSMAFPARTICQETAARDMEPIEVGPAGVLYSHSTIHVSATRQTPYTIGYVDFPNGLRVLAQVRGIAADAGCDIPVVLDADADGWFVVPAKKEV
ncbi:Zn-ribbon domain-containing OB-fold protein [Pseudoprimorskyibacter insulae]|uniref:ChsH2 C-terminal OB-fold domain-containing protein n=1 Tax=Pseudoprimorskyibacter insulae TaxID=1695997 RepID=A0A2R8B054_9RHOB|nr:OB-fold domain-containing protein [Pseudoprimorskyibacter insulae]SPF81514.1 hypothetical protein PRI8871_03338 [Pseudoprimorskyibacter insulae]